MQRGREQTVDKQFESINEEFDSVNSEIKSVRHELTELRSEVKSLANQNGLEHQQMMQAIKELNKEEFKFEIKNG